MALSKDSKIIATARGVRAFGQAFIGVILVLYLGYLSFSPFAIGVLISMAYVGAMLSNIVVGIYADRFGRKRTLLVASLVQFLLPTILLSSQNFFVIAAAYFMGQITLTGTGRDGFAAIEQSILGKLGESGSPRIYVFSVYSFVSQLFAIAGSLFIGVKSLIANQPIESFRIFFLAYALIGLVLFGLYLAISGDIEAAPRKAEEKPTTTFWSRRGLNENSTIFKMAGLFSFEAFGSSIQNQSIITLWFVIEFHFGVSALAVMFAAQDIMQLASIPVATKIAHRIGLLRTIVWTQIPSNILLIIMGLSPFALLAEAIYLGRSFVNIMDQPSRQAYVASIVEPENRTLAYSVNNTSTRASGSVGTSIGGFLMQNVLTSAPLFASSAIKIVYDVLFYASFRLQKIKS